MNKCIGLFGTCGKSTWRDSFMKEYSYRNIEFFNPQVKDWKPELAVIEADHLANDAIVLFPITNETYAMGSLAETGFSILNAIKLEVRRDFVIMVDPKLEQSLMEDQTMAKESMRARALILQHIKKLNIDNVYLVPNLDTMLKVSILLWNSMNVKMEIRKMINDDEPLHYMG